MTNRGSWGYSGWEAPGLMITGHVSRTLRTPRRVIKFTGPPVRTLEDMSHAEVAELERTYGCRVVGKRFEWGCDG